ncbi:unnamed protein product [Taenia asiatica]|uniref:BAF250_C domain-containing protein n=1 Tax=Taenia asiatica TaxID=60517 RepID=A0A0R3VTU6_TAEAS|nr:unnamed protein product [Taenia asiatica]
MADERDSRAAKKERKYPDDDLWPPTSSSASTMATKLGDFPQIQFESNLIDCAESCGIKIPQGLAIAMVMLRSKHVDQLEMKPPHNFLLDRHPPLTDKRKEQIREVALWLLDMNRTVNESMEFLEPASPHFTLHIILEIVKLIKPCPLAISNASCGLIKNISFFRDGNPIFKDELEAWTQTTVELSDGVTTPKDVCVDQEHYLCTYSRETQICALNLFNTTLYYDAEAIVNKRLRDCVAFIIVNAMHLVRAYCNATTPSFCAELDPLAVMQATKSQSSSVKLFIQRLSEEIAPILFDIDRGWFIEQMHCRSDITDQRQWVRQHKDAFAVHIMMNILCSNTQKAWNSQCGFEDILIHTEEHSEDCVAEFCACRLSKVLQATRQSCTCGPPLPAMN